MVRWVIGLVVLSIVGWLVVDGRGDSASDPATETIVARGWDDLVPCSLVRSFDGGKVLRFEDDGRVSMWEVLANAKPKTDRDGNWSFDEFARRYVVSFDKDVKSYNLQSFDDGKYCLLVNGDMQSANLKESWFSFSEDDDPYVDDGRDRDAPGL
jgi:hypothetical protein